MLERNAYFIRYEFDLLPFADGILRLILKRCVIITPETTREADSIAPPSRQQQAKSFIGADEKVGFSASRIGMYETMTISVTTSLLISCVQINETPISPETGKDEP